MYDTSRHEVALARDSVSIRRLAIFQSRHLLWKLQSLSQNSYSTHKASGLGDLSVFFTLSAEIKARPDPPVAGRKFRGSNIPEITEIMSSRNVRNVHSLTTPTVEARPAFCVAPAGPTTTGRLRSAVCAWCVCLDPSEAPPAPV